MAGVLCTKHTTHWLLMRQRPNSTLYHVPLPALAAGLAQSYLRLGYLRRRPSHGFERRGDGLRERCHPQAIRRPSRARACAVPQATRAPTCANVVDDASFSACGSGGGRARPPLGLDVRSRCRPRARSRCFREMFVYLRRGLARALGLRGGGVSASKSSTTAKGSHFGWPKAKRKTHDEAGY